MIPPILSSPAMNLPPRKMLLAETVTSAMANKASNCLVDCDSALNTEGICGGSCFSVCPRTCKFLLVEDDDNSLFPIFPQSPPPPRLLPVLPSPIPGGGGHVHKKSLVVVSMSVLASIVAVFFLIVVLIAVFRTIRSRRRRRNLRNLSSRSREWDSAAEVFAADLIDEDRGPVIDHPIWYIRTVGLEQSVIDSIAVFRYKKSDGFIDGIIDCSICLSEFEEEESLRLLPKCNHAFHIPCIDTWLRSHTNCPLCRAPIVANSSSPAVADSSENLSPGEEEEEEEESQLEISESSSSSSQTTLEEMNEAGSEISISNNSNEEAEYSESPKPLVLVRNHSRVLQSDVSLDLQPVRRSVSLDSSLAMAIQSCVADIELVQGKDSESVVTREMKVCKSSKRGSGSGGSYSFRKLMKRGSSMAGLLKKEPIAMKRSVSSASTSGHGGRRIQESILPL